MLEKRIIICLDVRNGRTTKGIKFKENIDIGDPVEMARFYYEQGVDELVFYDITASSEKRKIMIEEGASLFGSQCIVLGMDALHDPDMPSRYRVLIDGGRVPTDLDALAWAKQAESLGAGEIVMNSIDADGTRQGYELTVTKLIAEGVGIPVVASGGAGKIEHILDVFEKAHADAALIASMVHFGTFTISRIKSYLHKNHIPMRLDF
jgi:cyclase